MDLGNNCLLVYTSALSSSNVDTKLLWKYTVHNIQQQTNTGRNISKQKKYPIRCPLSFACLAQTSFHSSEKDGVSGRTSNSYLLTWDRNLFITSELCFCRIWLSWKNSLCVPWKIKIYSSLESLLFQAISFHGCFSWLHWSSEHTYEGRKQLNNQICILYSPNILESPKFITICTWSWK